MPRLRGSNESYIPNFLYHQLLASKFISSEERGSTVPPPPGTGTGTSTSTATASEHYRSATIRHTIPGTSTSITSWFSATLSLVFTSIEIQINFSDLVTSQIRLIDLDHQTAYCTVA